MHDCKDAMARIEVDSQLIGSLAEVYYKEYSDQKGGWAFTSLEGVHTKIDSMVLDFKIGFNRLSQNTRRIDIGN